MNDYRLRILRTTLPVLVPILSIALLAPSAWGQPGDLECYKIKDPLRVKGLVDIDTTRFGRHAGCKISPAKLFCTPATNTVREARNRKTPITPNDFWSPPAPGSQICYHVTCPKEPLPDQEVTDKFGTRTLENLKAQMVCTPARPAAAATIPPEALADSTPGAEEPVGFPATGQTTCLTDDGNPMPCDGTGRDAETQAGAPLQYTDNGDGTVTDLNTGLMWEKKSDDSTLHDKDFQYPWAGVCTGDGLTVCNDDPDCATLGVGGTCKVVDGQHGQLTVFKWADRLNQARFAGYDDWRVPNAKELGSIVDYEADNVYSIAPAFYSGCVAGCTVTTCSCTADSELSDPLYWYWTSTTAPGNLFASYVRIFDEGTGMYPTFKTDRANVRAVRGGV